jgi:hypothetical protein
VIAEARRHVPVAEVTHDGGNGQRRTLDRELRVELELERIQSEGGRIGGQPEARARALRLDHFEAFSARESVPGEAIFLRTETIAAAGQHADDGEEQGRAAVPDGRIAAPQQVVPGRIPKRGQLRAERIDLGAELAGADGDPFVLVVRHGRELLLARIAL